MFFPPLDGSFLAQFYDSIGIDARPFEYQRWGGSDPEVPLGRTSYTQGGANSGFFFGAAFGQALGNRLLEAVSQSWMGEGGKPRLALRRKGRAPSSTSACRSSADLAAPATDDRLAPELAAGILQRLPTAGLAVG
jgi:hypothetical protein